MVKICQGIENSRNREWKGMSKYKETDIFTFVKREKQSGNDDSLIMWANKWLETIFHISIK